MEKTHFGKSKYSEYKPMYSFLSNKAVLDVSKTRHMTHKEKLHFVLCYIYANGDNRDNLIMEINEDSKGLISADECIRELIPELINDGNIETYHNNISTKEAFRLSINGRKFLKTKGGYLPTKKQKLLNWFSVHENQRLVISSIITAILGFAVGYLTRVC